MNFRKQIFILAIFFATFSFAEEENRIVKAWELYEKGHYKEATKLVEEEVQEQEKKFGKESPEVSQVLSILGGLYRQIGEYEKAEEPCQRALQIDEKAYGEMHARVAADLNILALLYADLGKFREAEPLLKRAFNISEKLSGPESNEASTAMNNLATLYESLGEFEKAESYLKKSYAIEIKINPSEDPDIALSANNLAHLYLEMARYEEAEKLYTEALRIRKKVYGQENPSVAQSENNLAMLYFDMGRYAEAEPYFKSALAVYEKLLGPDHPDVATTIMNLAGLYTYMGQNEEAEPLYKKAVELREKSFGKDHYEVAGALNNLAAHYRTIGKSKEAEPLLQRTVEIFQKILGPEHPYNAEALNNLAVVYDDLKKYEEAEKIYRQVLEIRKKALGPDHPDVAISMNNIAAIFRTTKHYKEAEAAFLEALRIREKSMGTEHPEQTLLLSNLAAFYDQLGSREKAESYFERAIRIQTKTRENVLSILSERQKMVFMELQEPLLQSYISHVAEFKKDDPVSVKNVFNQWLKWKGAVQEAQGRYLDALMHSQDPQVQQKWNQLQQIRKELARLYISGAGTGNPEDYKRKITELSTQKEELEASLSKLSKSFSLEQQAGTVNVETLNSLIPGDSVLLDFQEGYRYEFSTGSWKESRYRIFFYAPGKKPVLKFFDIGPADEINALINEYLKRVKVARARGVKKVEDESEGDSAEQLARKLYLKLIAPLSANIGDRKKMIISPDGALHLIPFEILLSEDGRYLIDRFEITYLPSVRDVVRWQNTGATKNQKALILADPDYDLINTGKRGKPEHHAETRALQGTEFSRLPGTRTEALAVQQILTQSGLDVSLFMDKEATEDIFLKSQAPRVLHLATHGFFLPETKEEKPRTTTTGKLSEITSKKNVVVDNPLARSGIVLAGANRALREGTDTGIVSADKVLTLNLRGTDLVILSACETAVGDVQRGEGVFGLKRSFILAGARTMFMSLWQVSDEATQQLMTSFYKLWASGLTKSEALYKARLELKKEYPDPYYWAPFILLGSPD